MSMSDENEKWMYVCGHDSQSRWELVCKAVLEWERKFNRRDWRRLRTYCTLYESEVGVGRNRVGWRRFVRFTKYSSLCTGWYEAEGCRYWLLNVSNTGFRKISRFGSFCGGFIIWYNFIPLANLEREMVAVFLFMYVYIYMYISLSLCRQVCFLRHFPDTVYSAIWRNPVGHSKPIYPAKTAWILLQGLWIFAFGSRVVFVTVEIRGVVLPDWACKATIFDRHPCHGTRLNVPWISETSRGSKSVSICRYVWSDSEWQHSCRCIPPAKLLVPCIQFPQTAIVGEKLKGLLNLTKIRRENVGCNNSAVRLTYPVTETPYWTPRHCSRQLSS